MVLGLSLGEVIYMCGHQSATSTAKLVWLLRKGGLGHVCAPLVRKMPLPARAIVKMRAPNWKGWHWGLVWDGVLYDPSPTVTRRPLCITSYLRLEP